MYIPHYYNLEELAVKPKHKPDKKAFRHLKYLSPKLPIFNCEELNLQKLKKVNCTTRDVLKHSFMKKIHDMELQPHVFTYYAPYLRGKITQLAFTMYMYYNICYPIETQVIVYKSFGSFKHLKKLIVPETFLWKYVKMAKKIRGLQRLKFVMTETQVTKYPTLFRNLSSLQILHLKIFEDQINLPSKTDDEKLRMVSLTWRFLRDIMSLKHLKELTLILKDCMITKDQRFFGDFIELLAKSPVERYNLTSSLGFLKDIEQTAGINKVLSEVDSLDLAWNSYYFGFKSAPEKKKSMNFLFPEESNPNISNLLSKFSRLKFLTISQTNVGTATFDVPQPNPHLEAFKLDIDFRQESKTFDLIKFAADYLSDSQLKSIHLRLAHLPENIFKQLLRIHDSLSPLKTETYELDLANPKNWSYVQQNSANPTALVPLAPDVLNLLTLKRSGEKQAFLF